ncbi:MAG: TolC family protein [Myxococcales bacterium]|nr:TolC family protein [Myxococcales bacterium]
MKRGFWNVAAVVAGTGLGLCAPTASADESGCAGVIGRDEVVPCALAASDAIRAQEEAIAAGQGRLTAAQPYLPSNPVLSLGLGPSFDLRGGRPTPVWSAALSQEIEVGGQRDARIDAAEAELRAARALAQGTRREVAVGAWNAYFDALAGDKARALAVRLEALTQALAVAARARAEAGAASSIEADVAEAEALRALGVRLAAERQAQAARRTLALYVGADRPAGRAGVSAEGALAPLPVAEALASSPPTDAAGARPDVLATEAEEAAQAARAEEHRSAQLPNLTLSIFGNGTHAEAAVGIGVSFPIPLPEPAGRLGEGDIAEAEALGRRAGAEAERLRRTADLELANAVEEYRSRRLEAQAFTAARIAQAERVLGELAAAVTKGELAVKDAVQAERPLVELLVAAVEAQRALCLASVELARAGGVALEAGVR